MATATYHVVLFHHRGNHLVASDPMEASDYIGAIGEAQRQAQEAGGAIVFARTGSGEIEIIFRTGDLPETIPGIAT
jgi:hypothetical protein